MKQGRQAPSLSRYEAASGSIELREQIKPGIFLVGDRFELLNSRIGESAQLRFICRKIMINSDAKKSFDEMIQNLAILKAEIDRTIYNLIQQYTEWQEKIAALAEIGTRSGIEKEIKKIQAEKDKLSKELSLSDEEISMYDETIKEISILEGNISSLQSYIEIIRGIQSLVSLIEADYDLSDDLQEEMRRTGEKAIKAADDIWRIDQESILSRLRDKIQNLQGQREEKAKVTEPLAVKISENEAIKKLTDSLQAEEAKRTRFNETESQANKSKEKYESLLKQLVLSFIRYRTLHKEYADSINNNTALAAEDLEFSAETPFRREAFAQVIQDSFDRRTSFKAYIDVESFSEEWLSEENISTLIDAVISGRIRLTKNKTPENALREMLGDWYNSAYRVSMDGDLIDEMSPGKKALVLLKMLISLAESTCPILVDQPEDDLDNRSIFDELIPFLKKKKVVRQVIVVTHNANVVLGADADEIIVANQDGKNSPNKEFRFEYRTGSIEDDLPEDIGRTDTLGKQGIQQQICDILEGGQSAFDLRKHKYRI